MHKTATKRHRSKYDLNDDITRIKELLGETAFDIKGRAGEVLTQTYENARDRTLGVKTNIEKHTQDKPFTSLGISLVTGLFIGYFMHK